MSYSIIANAILAANGSVRSDILVVNVSGDDGCGCECVTNINADNYIQFGTQEVFVNKYPRFFVSAIAPTNANLLDRWYDLLNQTWYDYVTDGVTDFWAISGVGTPITPPGGPGGGPGSDLGTTGNITIKLMQPLTIDGVSTTFPLISVDLYTPNITTPNSLLVSS